MAATRRPDDHSMSSAIDTSSSSPRSSARDRANEAASSPSPVLHRRRRRGPKRDQLVERVWELDALEQTLTVARAGAGSTVVIDAAPGLGKTRLIEAAGDMARELGMRVLAATGVQLERDFPFGLPIQLFEPLWRSTETDGEARDAFVDGSAKIVTTLLDSESAEVAPDSDADRYRLIHGLVWATHNLVSSPLAEDDRGLAILVDDLHWADAFSLRFLADLAERSEELPIALIVAERAGEESRDHEALARLRAVAARHHLRPAPLTEVGVAELVERRFPVAHPGLAGRCAQATGGIPFLVVELLDELAAEEPDLTVEPGAHLSEMVPARVR
jgi:AAA ATPase-like protein